MAKPRDNNPAFEKLLTRALRAHGQKRTPACPAPDILAAYYERSLSPNEVSNLESHASSCSDCQSILASLARSDESLTRTPELRPSPFAWLFNWRLLAPATAALLVAAVWFGTRQTLETDRDTIALNQQAPPAPPPPTSAEPSPQRSIDAPAKATTPVFAPPADASSTKRSPRLKTAAPSTPPAPIVAANTPAIATSEKDLEKSSAMATPEERAKLLNRKNEQAIQARDQVAPSTDVYRSTESQAKQRQESAAQAAPMAAPSPKQSPPKEQAHSSGARSDQLADEKAVESKKEANSRAVQLSPGTASGNAGGFGRSRQTQGQLSSRAIITSPANKTLWRIVPDGKVEVSRNQGTSWQPVEIEPGARVLAASAPAETVCWLVGDQGIILRTTDLVHWEKLAPPSNSALTQVTASDEKSAVVTDSAGRSYETKDAGRTWKQK